MRSLSDSQLEIAGGETVALGCESLELPVHLLAFTGQTCQQWFHLMRQVLHLPPYLLKHDFLRPLNPGGILDLTPTSNSSWRSFERRFRMFLISPSSSSLDAL
jgi:hypothetical protein